MGENFELRLFSEVSRLNEEPQKLSTASVKNGVDFILSLESPEDIKKTFRLFKNNYENGLFDESHFIYFIKSSIQYLKNEIEKIYENINNSLKQHKSIDLKIYQFWNYISHISEIFTYEIRKFIEELVSKWELDISLQEEVFNCIDEVNRVYISEISYFLNRWNYRWQIGLWFILSSIIPLKKLKTQNSKKHIEILKNLFIYGSTITEADTSKQSYFETLDRVLNRLGDFSDELFKEIYQVIRYVDKMDDDVNSILLDILERKESK